MLNSINFLLLLFNWFANPEFKGGNRALESFFDKRRIYPSFSKNNCIEGTIYVSFQLDEQGKVYNAQINKGLGIDLDEEALRLIKLTSGNWDLGVDYNKNSKLVIPVNFSLKDFGCNERSADEIKTAIELYKGRKGLEDAVLNYYRNKEKGIADTKNEAEIMLVKAQLGIDEEFISKKLAEAKKKIKQGDKDGACEVLNYIKYTGSNVANELIQANCK